MALIRLTTTRGALGLYGALLVLPTLVFGWLYWRELQRDYQEQLDAVPATAKDGARRIVGLMRDQLDQLLESEERRPFYHYGTVFSPEDAIDDELALQPSPLVKSRAPRGVLAWFNFDRKQGTKGEIDLFLGRDKLEGEEARLRDELIPALERFRARKIEEGLLREWTQLENVEPEPLPLHAVAIHLGHKDTLECLRMCAPLIKGLSVSTGVSKFHLDFYLDEDGTPRAIASRRVLSQEPPSDLPSEAHCLTPLLDGFALHQGFFLDVGWLFEELPFLIAAQALGETEELIRSPGALPFDKIDTVFADILPVRDLGFTANDGPESAYGKLEVSIDTDHIDARYKAHLTRFLGVALMLVLSLASGFTFLYRSVGRELEQAHRTQNFVASVTHELRTPLSTIQLHGEMLLDGWVDDPDKRREYYRRIVRETKRLSTLVENVLEKSKLKEDEDRAGAARQPQRAHRAPCATILVDPEGNESELSFDLGLANGLPPVWADRGGGVGHPDSNLIENARKYAPVAEGGDRILPQTRIRTRGRRRACPSRGRRPRPGRTARPRTDKVFEAFYRVGSEATRTTTGTGLGLHLVQLHADAVGARTRRATPAARAAEAIFRVAYRSAVI